MKVLILVGKILLYVGVHMKYVFISVLETTVLRVHINDLRVCVWVSIYWPLTGRLSI